MRQLHASSILPAFLLTMCLCGASPHARAQGVELFEFSGSGGTNFGAAVGTGGDIDGDGRNDAIVGAFLDPTNGPEAGAVRVYSGATGALLRSFFGDGQGDNLGYSVAGAGDVDADGYDDVIAGASGGGYARVWSGRTGLILHTLFGDAPGDAFGSAVAGVGDIDQDGNDDVAVGAPANDTSVTDAGSVRVFSGYDASTIYTLLGEGLSTEFGYALSSAGFADGDDVPDIIVGTSTGSNQAQLFSGVDGTLLFDLSGDANLDWFGTAVAGAGDVNHDGSDDVIVGASQGLLGPGYARIFSGADGSVIRTLHGAAPLDLFGWSVSGAGDVDGDGRFDVLVGAPFAEGFFGEPNAGQAAVFSGANGNVLTIFYGIDRDGGMGWSVAGGPCSNALAGAPIIDRAMLFDSFQEPGTTNYCVTSPNTVGPGALISSAGTTSIAANDFALTVSGCPPFANGLFFYGQTAVQTPFGNGTRCVGNPFFRRPVITMDSTGFGAQAIDYGALPPIAEMHAGEVWRFQFWYRNPAAGGALFNLSDGLRALFAP